MTSAINTGSIDPNYPVPGVNNDSQGFRTNFGSIQQNLNTAATEISDLQGKVVLKSALTDTALNNDMANALISNALVSGFRSTTAVLGTNLTGNVNIDITLADVQIANISGNIALQFSKWAPAGTQSNVEVVLNIANANAGYTISLPTTITDGTLSLEGYSGNGVGGNLTVPRGVSRLHWVFSTLDCGTTVEVTPTDRPRAAYSSVGLPTEGGNFAATGTLDYANIANANIVGIGTSFTTEFIPGRILKDADNSNAIIGTVSSIASDTTLTLTANAVNIPTANANITRSGAIGNAWDIPGQLSFDSETIAGNVANYIYVCVANHDGANVIWNRVQSNTY